MHCELSEGVIHENRDTFVIHYLHFDNEMIEFGAEQDGSLVCHFQVKEMKSQQLSDCGPGCALSGLTQVSSP